MTKEVVAVCATFLVMMVRKNCDHDWWSLKVAFSWGDQVPLPSWGNSGSSSGPDSALEAKMSVREAFQKSQSET